MNKLDVGDHIKVNSLLGSHFKNGVDAEIRNFRKFGPTEYILGVQFFQEETEFEDQDVIVDEDNLDHNPLAKVKLIVDELNKKKKKSKPQEEAKPEKKAG